jgi:hypothetical protein
MNELKPQIGQPIPFFLGAAIIAGFDTLLILFHQAEMNQATHGLITGLLCVFAIFGWLPLIMANPPFADGFDWIPAVIMTTALIVNYGLSKGFDPLPYQTWSFHSFAFWFVNAAFAGVALTYFVWTRYVD